MRVGVWILARAETAAMSTGRRIKKTISRLVIRPVVKNTEVVGSWAGGLAG